MGVSNNFTSFPGEKQLQHKKQAPKMKPRAVSVRKIIRDDGKEVTEITVDNNFRDVGFEKLFRGVNPVIYQSKNRSVASLWLYIQEKVDHRNAIILPIDKVSKELGMSRPTVIDAIKYLRSNTLLKPVGGIRGMYMVNPWAISAVSGMYRPALEAGWLSADPDIVKTMMDRIDMERRGLVPPSADETDEKNEEDPIIGGEQLTISDLPEMRDRAEEKRHKNAERQRRFRERQRAKKSLQPVA